MRQRVAPAPPVGAVKKS